MKLLMLAKSFPPYGKGGETIYNWYICSYFKKRVFLKLIAPHPFFKISLEKRENLEIIWIPTFGKTFLTKIPSFSYFASRVLSKLYEKYDLIFSFPLPLLSKISSPLVVIFHNTRLGEALACKKTGKNFYSFLNKLYIPTQKFALKKAQGIILLSPKMLSEIEALGGTKAKIEIIPQGVDTNFFKPKGERKFENQEKKILYVGRLDPRKGLETLFFAFQKISQEIKAKLFIVGEGREKKKLQNLAKFLNLSIEFLGKIPHQNLPQIYNQADLFILPSLYEAYELVSLEAAACGTPTIVSSASPLSQEGFPFFEKGNVKELVQLVLEILPYPEKLKNLSQKGKKIAKMHDWEIIGAKTLNFLKQFL